MKRNRGSWILFGVVVLLSIYAYFGEYKGKEKEKASKEQKALILKDMKADQIDSIEVDNLNQKINLNRSNEGWVLVSPVSDSADSADIDTWIKQMTEEKSLSIAVEGSDIQWNYFGFDKPVKSITVKTTSNQKITVEVSDKKNFEGNNFIRFPGQNQVLVAGSTWGTHTGKTVFDLRNKKIFRHQVSNVQRFSIKNKKSKLEIENKDARWLSPSQSKWQLDQNSVRELVSKIGELKATEFVAEKEQVQSSIKVLKLASSDVIVDVKLSEGDWTAKLYQTKDKTIYAEVPKSQLLVKVASDIFERLNVLSLVELRDYKLPFAGFDKTKVEKFSYETSLKKASLVKKNSLWEIEPADTVNEVQQDKVSGLLEVVKNLVAKQYLAKSELRKDISKQKIQFKDAQDKIYFELQFSDSETKKINNEDKTIRYAKTNLYDEPFLMDETEFEKLNLNEIIKIKVNNEGKSLPVDNNKEEKHAK